MKRHLEKFILFMIFYTFSFSSDESLKNTYYESLNINKQIQSLGYYFYNDEYDEHVLSLKYHNDYYVVDLKNTKDDSFFSFGEYSYSYSGNLFIVGMSAAPTGGHGRNIFLFKEDGKELKLIGHISPEIRDIWEDYPQENKNIWELKDIDKDGKIEFLVFTLETGFIFFEITDKGFVVDYNSKNYETIRNKIKTKKDKKINDSFINGKINKKNVEKVFNLNNLDEFVIKKVEVKK